MVLSTYFQGIGAALAVLVLGWLYNWDRKRVAMKASQIDTAQAKDKEDRELLETIYSAMVTAPATQLNPHPIPGLVETVAENTKKLIGIEDRLETVEAKLDRPTVVTAHLTDGNITGTVEIPPE